MTRSTVAVVAPLLLAGCSLIYNPSNLPDPRVIDAAMQDANPCALEITSIAPVIIQEGEGANGSPPALIVVRGNNIANSNLKVVLSPKDATAVQLDPVTDARASGDTTYLAFSVVAPVDTKHGAPADVLLDVTVTQDAPADGTCMGAASRTLSGKLTLRELPELTALGATPDPAIATTLYSMIMLPTTKLTLVPGGAAIALNAVSSIKLGELVASASGTTGGPGGYSAGITPGPSPGQPGEQAAVLGQGGGGGGGGFASNGGKGADQTGNGGPGGAPAGQPQVLSYDANRASAGGTGGRGLTALGNLVSGGSGGGGGGAVVLSAGGDIAAGDITATGSGGGAGSGSALASGGGGGGGAGGRIVVRTASGALALGQINVGGGGGGTPGGGAGSVGRVRWDAPGGAAPSVTAGTPHRGPTFTAVTRIVTELEPSFTLAGTPGDEIDVRVIDSRDTPHAGPHVAFNPSGVATIIPTLVPGYNQICAKLVGGTESEPAANTCITVAYLPPGP